MNDPILRTAHRHLVPVIFVLSLLLLWRGHNLPGGGFLGGLAAAMGGVLIFLSEGAEALRRKLKIDAEWYFAIGLALALLSALWGPMMGRAFFEAAWLPAVELPLIGKVLIGTPLLFDVGVYGVVIGFSLSVLLLFGRIDRWK